MTFRRHLTRCLTRNIGSPTDVPTTTPRHDGSMNLAGRIANADQLHAEVRDARDCDALDPCPRCRALTREVRRVARDARVAAYVAEQRQVAVVS